MDFDYLGYPVYEGTALNWASICTDRVCIGRFREKADFSMISVPEFLLNDVLREVHAACEAEMVRSGHLPEMEDVLKDLLEKNPATFDLVDLPGLRDLFSLTMASWGEGWGRRD